MTPTQAATSYALSFKNYLSTADQERLSEAFTKGVEWAVADPEILKGVIKGFLQYAGIDRGSWLHEGDMRTTDDLIKFFVDYINSKKNETGQNETV